MQSIRSTRAVSHLIYGTLIFLTATMVSVTNTRSAAAQIQVSPGDPLNVPIHVDIGTGIVPDSNRVIIKLNPTGSDSVVSLQNELQARTVREYAFINVQVWDVGDIPPEAVVRLYQNDPRVAHIEVDNIIRLDRIVDRPASLSLYDLYRLAGQGTSRVTNTTNDFFLDLQWGIHNDGSNGALADADIDAPEAWDIITSTDVIVGVIDSGVDYDHEDLIGNMWTNPDEIPGNGIDDDANGFVDDIHGWDFFDDDADPMDVNGHGTHVAGTIAASGNNGIGISGVAWNAQIMALRFIGPEGWGYLSDAVAAIEYSIMMDARLTNNSWGGGGYSQSLADAIEAAGLSGQLFVVSAGNDTNDNDAAPTYPASYEFDHLITVASTTNMDELSSFSNYGATTVDIGAPGSTIVSAYPGNSYVYMSGTSMAGPHVAGAVALLWGAYPDETAEQIKARILQTADPVAGLLNHVLTGGRLNLHRALTYRSTSPQLEVSPSAFSFDLHAGTAASATLAITNSGSAPLTWNVETAPVSPEGGSWLTIEPISGTVAISNTVIVTLTADATGIGDGSYTTTLSINSNDQDSPVPPIQVGMNVTTVRYPEISIQTGIVATYWPDEINPDGSNMVEVPITLDSKDFDLGAVAFSLDMDETCLSFDPADADNNGVPDSFRSTLPVTTTANLFYDASDVDGELDLIFADLNAPVTPLLNGIIATLTFEVVCEPAVTEPRVSLLRFAIDPMATFSTTAGDSIPGSVAAGSIEITLGRLLGDCNGNLLLGAADASATILEIFDGDGAHWLDTPNGTFAGSRAGCDANLDQRIDAGDLICTVLLIFDVEVDCQPDPLPAGGSRTEETVQTTITIDRPVVNHATHQIELAILFDGADHQIGAVTFSLSFDPQRLIFDQSDRDLDSSPDSVDFTHDTDHTNTVLFDAEENRIDVMIADMNPVPEITPLAEGRLMTISFGLAGGMSANDVHKWILNAQPGVDFASDIVSVADIQGQSLPVQRVNEMNHYRNQTSPVPHLPLIFVPLVAQ